MEQEKCYREEDLSLQDLAEKLSIPSHHLSQVINEKLIKNYSDYVNTYRIEEAMEHLADSWQKRRKILSIAFEVGFNTKATFNYVFKKHTGMTPSQYRKSQTR
jgi:YesN/AraC family two-component response regulator